MIVEAGAIEAAALAATHAAAFDHPWDEAALAALLADPGVLGLATDGGFILIRGVADEAEILTLAVAPEARRRGLGRQLVEMAGRRAALRGAEHMFLEVAADNEAALALYRTTGFEAEGRRKGYYRRDDSPPIDALVLKKPLCPPA